MEILLHTSCTYHSNHLWQFALGGVTTSETLHTGWRIKVTGELLYKLNKRSIVHAGHSSLQELVTELRPSVCAVCSQYIRGKVRILKQHKHGAKYKAKGLD